MASIKWKTGTTGDWNQASNWSPGNVPGASDAVTINAAGNYDVIVDDSESAQSTSLASAGATLAVEGGPDVTFSLGGNLSVTAGTLLVVADDPANQHYGHIGGGTITVGASGTLAAESFQQDPNGSVFEIHSVVNLAGTTTIASDTQIIIYDGGTLGGSISGAGTLEIATPVLSASAVSTYTSNVAALSHIALTEIVGPTVIIAKASSGTISGSLLASGAGSIVLLGSNTITLAGGVDISDSSNLLVGGGSKIALTSNLQLDNSGQIFIAAGASVTTSGDVSLGLVGLDSTFDTAIYGAGTFTTTGDTTVQDPLNGANEIFFGESISWSNTGSVETLGNIALNTVASDSVHIVNQAGATLDLQNADANIIDHTSDGTDMLSNAGTLGRGLDKSAGATNDNGTSTLAAAVTSTGLIDVETGTLAFTDGGTIGGTLSGSGTLLLQSGTFTLGNLAGSGNLAFGPGATIVETSPSNIRANTSLDGNNTLTIAAGTTDTYSGALTIGDASGGITLNGGGTLSTTGVTTFANEGGTPDLVITALSTYSNAGVANDGGAITFNAADGDGGTVVNAAGGTFNLTTDNAGLSPTSGTGGGKDAFNNAGTLAKTGGTGTSTIGVGLTNTGTIVVGTGTIALASSGALGGIVNGAGVLDLAAAFTTGGIAGNGHILVSGTSLTETKTGSVTAGLIVNESGVLSVGSAIVLTKANNLTLGDGSSFGYLSGPGTLTTTGTTTITDGTPGGLEAVANGGLVWNNSGTINDAGLAYFGYTGNGVSTGSATLANTGTLALTTDDSSILSNDTSVVSKITNAGLLEKTAGTGLSTISTAITNTGTISVAAGTLALTGGGAVNGTLNGTGLLDLGGGSFTSTGIAGAGNLAITAGASLTETATGTITAKTLVSLNGVLGAAKAITLTQTGNLTLGDGSSFGYLSGPGTIVTTGTTAITDNQAAGLEGVANGGLIWNNNGTINDAGLVYFGYTGNGVSTGGATLANTGTLALTTDDASILNNDGSVVSRITSSGLLEKTGGTGLSTISVTTTSTGSAAVTSGTLALTNGGGLSGALNGAGLLDLGGGSFTSIGIAGAGNLAITAGASLTETATGTITAKTLVSLNGVLGAAKAITLTQTGNLTLGDGASFGYLSGPGTIVTTGTTAITDNQSGGLEAVLNGGLTWNNSGTINDAGLAYVGYTGNGVSTGGAMLANTGTLALTTDDASILNNDTSVVSRITSSGLLEKTGGTATSTISVATTSTGSVVVSSGTLALTAGGGVSGTLNGAGLLDLGGGSFTSTGIAGAGNLAITAGASLTETATGTITAKALVSANGTLAAAKGITLTETGNLTLGDGASFGYLSGPGTIVTTGTTTIGDGGAGGLEAVLNGGLVWNNSGTISDGGLLFFGYTGNGVSTGGAALANTGTLALTTDDATLQTYDDTVTDSLTNAGVIEKTGGTGVSLIALAITNTGTIEAASGTLQLERAITGTGLLKIDSGATLETSLAIPASQQVAFAGGAGATLKLDTPQSIGTLTNFTAGDRLDLANTTVSSATISGTTLTVVSDGGTYKYVSAGIAGEVVTTATDNNNGVYVSLYRGAIPTHTPEPLAFGNFHVGSTTGTLAHLTVTNSAPADGYSEKLNASFGGATAGFTSAGAFSLLAAGASNATALSATISTATAGAKTGTATLTLNSNGSGVDGRGLTALPSQTVHFTGGVYNYAAAGLASTTINLGHQHVGAAQSTALTLTNTVPGGGFSEGLDASFTASSGGATGSGSVSVLAAGASNATGLSIGFAAPGSGTLTGSETLTYVSDGAGTSGLGTTTLGTQAISVTGTFYNLAAAAPATTTIAFGNHHVGDIVAAQALKITNSAPAGAFSEALDAGFASATAGLTATGSITGLAAGASNAMGLTIAESTAAAGALAGGAVLSLVSDGTGIDGLGTTTLAGQTITVTGANYALAAGTLASATVNLGVIHAGTAASATLGLTNTAATGGYSEALDAGLSGATAGLSASGSITGLLAGQANASTLRLSVNTAATGAYTGTALLGLVSDGNGIDGLGTTTLAGQTITVTATVDNYAIATLEDPSGPALTGTSASETLNLGSVLQNGAALTAMFGALNGAAGTADMLGGTFASAGGAGFTNSGLGSFSGLSAGQDEHAQSVSLATGTAGTFSETVTLSSYGTNASGYLGALTPETLTIIGTITASVFHTYTLASQGPNIIQGADGSGDIFIATAPSINSHDVLSGGAGANSVTLVGAGQFDFGALKAGNFTNIPTLNATEGQAAMGTLAATAQLIYLNDSVGETLTVAAGTAAAGNTNAEAITIYGSAAANTIALAAGADQVFLGTGAETVTLGGAANQVTAGGGNALIRGTAAAAAAAVTGASTGTTRLEVTTGGAVTLNAADTNLTVQLDLAATLKLSAMSFITALGSTGADTITAGAAGQTLTGGAGIDILAGYSGGNDTFRDTAAGLNGDTIRGWTTGDTIDLTNISSATLKALSFTNNVLNVSDGHTASNIRFAPGLALGNFTVLGSDGSGGVLIGFHS